MKTMITLILAGLLALPTLQAQDNQRFKRIITRSIAGDDIIQLLDSLNSAIDTTIAFENLERAPLTITHATVQVVNRGHAVKGVSSPIEVTEYLMAERITLINNTDRRVKAVVLQFSHNLERKEVELAEWATIEPYGSYIFGERTKRAIEYVWLPINPEGFTVKVYEVRFEDGVIWQHHPSELEKTKVDTKPIPINRARPKYTEEALKNRIQGPVRMHLLVSIEGNVKEVRMVGSGLPDGLNQEALNEVHKMRFKPAMKNGLPVEDWVLYEVEFNLRTKTSYR